MQAQPSALETLWTVSDGLYEPESVAYDPISGKLYITNVKGYAKNGEGYISRINADGSDFEAKWVTNLNGPTGIIFYNGKLFFADIDQLKVIDAATGEIINAYKTDDQNPALNDVAVNTAGEIFVSGSGTQTVYKLNNEKLVTFIQDTRALQNANGLFFTHTALLTGGDNLHAWSPVTGEHLGILVPENSDVGDIDGITMDKNGRILLSLLNDPKVWQLRSNGETRPLSDQEIHAVDFTLHPDLQLLFTPQIDVKTKTYSVSAFTYNR
jgi:hypothetical protein